MQMDTINQTNKIAYEQMTDFEFEPMEFCWDDYCDNDSIGGFNFLQEDFINEPMEWEPLQDDKYVKTSYLSKRDLWHEIFVVPNYIKISDEDLIDYHMQYFNLPWEIIGKTRKFYGPERSFNIHHFIREGVRFIDSREHDSKHYFDCEICNYGKKQHFAKIRTYTNGRCNYKGNKFVNKFVQDNAEIQSNTAIDAMTGAIVNYLKQTDIARKVKTTIIISIASSVVSAICSMFHIFSESGVSGKMIAGFNLVQTLAALAYNVYSINSISGGLIAKITQEEMQETVRKIVNAITHYFVNGEAEKNISELVSGVDFTVPQTVADLANDPIVKPMVDYVENEPEFINDVSMRYDDDCLESTTELTKKLVNILKSKQINSKTDFYWSLAKAIFVTETSPGFNRIMVQEERKDTECSLQFINRIFGLTNNLTAEDLIDWYSKTSVEFRNNNAYVLSTWDFTNKLFVVNKLTNCTTEEALSNIYTVAEYMRILTLYTEKKINLCAQHGTTYTHQVYGNFENELFLVYGEKTMHTIIINEVKDRGVEYLAGLKRLFVCLDQYASAVDDESDRQMLTLTMRLLWRQISSASLRVSVIQNGGAMPAEKAIKYGIYVIGLIFACYETKNVFSTRGKTFTMGDGIIHMNKMRGALKQDVSELKDLISDLSYDVFGYTMFSDTRLTENMTNMYDRLVDALGKPGNYYTEDISRYYELKKLRTEAAAMVHSSVSIGRDKSTLYSNLSTSIRNQITSLTTLIDKLTQIFGSTTVRQETMALNLYGARGAGKSTFVGWFVEQLSQKIDRDPIPYNINFGENKFFKAYAGQSIGVYDEFLAMLDQDPIIGMLNGIHSCTPFNMEGADLSTKDQPCALELNIYNSNQPYVELKNKLSRGAEEGLYGRLFPVHFVNLKQTPNVVRSEVEHGSIKDIYSYEFRWYQQTPCKEHSYPMCDGPTPGKHEHYNAKLDVFDDHQYESLPGITYKLLTAQQLVDKMAQKIFAARIKYSHDFNLRLKLEIKKIMAKSATVVKYDKIEDIMSIYASKSQIAMSYRACVDSEIEGCYEWDNMTNTQKREYLSCKLYDVEYLSQFYKDLVTIQSNGDADHFVIAISGPAGTGKTVLARQLGGKLHRMLKMPCVEFSTVSADVARSVTLPSVVILNDAVYDELAYINFYDMLPKVCIIINTNNVGVRQVSVPQNTVTNQLIEESQNKSWYGRLCDKVIQKLYTLSSVKGYELEVPGSTGGQPGYARRFGIPGVIQHAGMSSRRSETTSVFLQTVVGFRVFDRTDISTRPIERSVQEVLDIAMNKFTNYIKKSAQCRIGEIDQQVRQEIATTNFDIEIFSENLDSLIELTRSPARMIRLALSSDNAPERIVISKRLRECGYQFSPLEFAIPPVKSVNEAGYVGIKIFKQLMAGNLEFSVRVSIREFDVYGINGVIYVDHHTEIPQSYWESKFNGDNVEIYKVTQNNGIKSENLVMVVPKNTIASWIRISYDWPYVREYVDNFDAESLFIYLESLSKRPEMAVAVQRIEHKRIALSDVLDKKNFFVKAWSMVSTGMVWTIIAAVLGMIVLTTFISSLVNMLVSCIFGYSTKYYQVKIFASDSQPMDIRVTAHVKKDVTNLEVGIPSGDLSDLTTDDLFNIVANDYRRQSGDKNPIETSICIQSEQTDPKKKKNKIKRSIPLIQNRAGYGDDNKIIKNKNRKLKQLNIVAQGNAEEIVGKVYGNFYEAHNIHTGAYTRAVGWYDRYVLVPAHLVREGQVESIRLTHIDTRDDYMTRVVCRVVGADIVVVEIPKELYPQFSAQPDITRLFQPEAQQLTACDAMMRTYQPTLTKFYTDGSRMATISYIDRYAYATTNVLEEAWVQEESNFYLDTPFVHYAAFNSLSNDIAKSGDCGTPLFGIRNGQANIIGLHFAKYGNSTVSTSLTREYMQYIKDWISKNKTKVCNGEIQSNEIVDYADDQLETFEYTDPAGVEQQTLLPIWTAQYIKTAKITNPPDWFANLNGRHTTYLGYNGDSKKSWFGKPSYSKTIYSDYLTMIPNEKRNAPNKICDVVDTSKLVRSINDKPSILLSQMNKYNEVINVDPELYQHYLDRAVNTLKPKYVKMYGGHRHRDLTFNEMLNGLNVNPRESLYGHLEAMNKDSSPGIELSRKFGKTKVGDLFAEDGVLSNTAPRIVLKDDEAGRYLQQLVTSTVFHWYNGRRCEGLSQDNLKAELRPNKKCDVGNSRMFVSFALHVLMAGRIVTGTMQAAMKRNRANAYAQIGISAEDFTQVYRRLQRTGAYGEAGDFTNWDKNTRSAEMLLCADLMAEVRYPSPREETEERDYEDYKTALQMCISSNVFSLAICDGYIYCKNKGQGSGHPLTTNINCIVNDIKQVACVMYLIDEHNKNKINANYVDDMIEYYKQFDSNGPVLDSINKNRNLINADIPSTGEKVFEIVDWITYGDDKASTIKYEYLWLINFVTMQKAYRELFGMAYDSPAKDGSVELVTPINKLNFISRDFSFDEKAQVVRPTLKMSSVNHLFHWIKNGTFEQYMLNLRASFNELIHYPKSVYNQYLTVYRDVITPIIEQRFNRSIEYIPPTWEDCRDDFARNSLSRVGAKQLSGTINRLKDINMENENLKTVTYTLKLEKIKMNPLTEVIRNAKIQSDRTVHLSVNHEERSFLEQSAYLRNIISEKNTLFESVLLPAYDTTSDTWTISCKCVPKFINHRRIQKMFSKIDGVKYALTQNLYLNVNGEFHLRQQVKFTLVDVAASPRVQISPNIQIQAGNGETEMKSVCAQGATESTLLERNETNMLMNLSRARGASSHAHESYYQQSTCQMAKEFQYLTTTKVPVGSTKGTVAVKLNWTDCLNPWMRAAVYGDRIHTGGIDIKIVTTSNTGMSGSLVFGYSTGGTVKNENDLAWSKRFYADVEHKEEEEFILEPYQGFGQMATQWGILGDDNKPIFYALVYEDLQSTFDNKTLYFQFHIYTRFNKNFKSYNMDVPTIPGDNPGSIFNAPLSKWFGTKQVVLDGNFNNQIVYDWNIKPQSTLIWQINFGEHLVLDDFDENNKNEFEIKLNEKRKWTRLGNNEIYQMDTDDLQSVIMRVNQRDDLHFDLTVEAVSQNLTFKKNGTSSTDKLPKMKGVGSLLMHAFKYRNNGSNETSYSSTDLYQTSVNKFLLRPEDGSYFEEAKDVDLRTDGKELIMDFGKVDVKFSSGMTIESLNRRAFYANAFIVCENLEILDIDKFNWTTVNGMTDLPDEMEYLPDNCKNVIFVDTENVVPSANVPESTYSPPTIFSNVDVRKILNEKFGDKDTVVMSIYEQTYDQFVMDLIYHGATGALFIRSQDGTDYGVCRYKTDDLYVKSVSKISGGSTIPTTNTGLNFVNRKTEQYARSLKRKTVSLNSEIQSFGGILGGILGGLGGALGSAQEQYNKLQQIEKNGEIQQALADKYGKQALEQIQKQAEEQMRILEKSGQISADQINQKGEWALKENDNAAKNILAQIDATSKAQMDQLMQKNLNNLDVVDRQNAGKLEQIEKQAQEDRITKGLNTGAMQFGLSHVQPGTSAQAAAQYPPPADYDGSQMTMYPSKQNPSDNLSNYVNEQVSDNNQMKSVPFFKPQKVQSIKGRTSMFNNRSSIA